MPRPLALVAGLLMAILLLGLLFGWPLMWATISTEETDSFDALSRSYAYVFQRPLHYLFYAFVAGVVGWLGWLLVANFAAGVIFGWAIGPPVGEAAPKATAPLWAAAPNSAALATPAYFLVHFFAG